MEAVGIEEEEEEEDDEDAAAASAAFALLAVLFAVFVVIAIGLSCFIPLRICLVLSATVSAGSAREVARGRGGEAAHLEESESTGGRGLPPRYLEQLTE